MDADITHDSLYLNYLNTIYGPNLLPIIKLFSAIIGFLFIIMIILSNLSESNRPKEKVQEKQQLLKESIVIKQYMTY
jgi:hypothetical protein